jgi:hypothetical protein
MRLPDSIRARQTEDMRHRLSFGFAYSPKVCEILDADWEMLRNAEKMQVFGCCSLALG